MDVHLKLWVYLTEELLSKYANEYDIDKRNELAFEILFDIVMYCYKEMKRQEQILGDFEDDDDDEKDINSHDILINMDILYDNQNNQNTIDSDKNDQNEQEIYSKFCHRIVNTVIHNALRDTKSKWSKHDLFTKFSVYYPSILIILLNMIC